MPRPRAGISVPLLSLMRTSVILAGEGQRLKNRSSMNNSGIERSTKEEKMEEVVRKWMMWMMWIGGGGRGMDVCTPYMRCGGCSVE